MDEIEIPIPICCPQCGVSMLSEFPVAVVVIALTAWQQMRLYTSCCPMVWDASASELQSIRDHVGESWLERQQKRLANERLLFPTTPPGLPC